MRHLSFVFALFAALAQGCAVNPQPPQECPVIIGASNFIYLGSQIVGGSNGGATLLSPDFTDLYDGRPSTLTRFEYTTSGSQTTASYWGLQVFPAYHGSVSPDIVDVGMVGILKTSLPAGAVVEIRDGSAIGPILASGTMQLDQSGVTTSVWLIFPRNNGNFGYDILFHNNLATATYMANGYQFTIGEILLSDTIEPKLMRNVDIGWANSSKLRQSSAGVSWNILQPPVRTLKMQLAPMTPVDAIDDGSQDVMTTLGRVMQGTVCAFIPFVTVDPFYGFDNQRNTHENMEIRSKTAMLGQFSSPPSMSMTGDVMWTANMQVTESI